MIGEGDIHRFGAHDETTEPTKPGSGTPEPSQGKSLSGDMRTFILASHMRSTVYDVRRAGAIAT